MCPLAQPVYQRYRFDDESSLTDQHDFSGTACPVGRRHGPGRRLAPGQGDRGAWLLTLALPALDLPTPVSGHYWLARCGAQSELERAEAWSFALRRALFLTTAHPAQDEELGIA